MIDPMAGPAAELRLNDRNVLVFRAWMNQDLRRPGAAGLEQRWLVCSDLTGILNPEHLHLHAVGLLDTPITQAPSYYEIQNALIKLELGDTTTLWWRSSDLGSVCQRAWRQRRERSTREGL